MLIQKKGGSVDHSFQMYGNYGKGGCQDLWPDFPGRGKHPKCPWLYLYQNLFNKIMGQ